ncbi:MAG: hypothetical protein EBZ83_06460 [Verrucomicrobia bacterium]|nr:hypothetical protein [Verrucomicrobiota bacterium]
MDSSLRSEMETLPSLLEREIQAFFHRQKERYDYGEMFEPVYFDMCEFVGRKGKRVRPLLFALTYRGLGGTKPIQDPAVLAAALSLELLHAFVLVHDDLIDRSEKRRGLPTFHKLVEQRVGRLSSAERTGHGVAVVVGDLLFALAVETLQTAGFPEPQRGAALGKLLSYITDTGVGEIFDILLGSRDIGRVSAQEIERTYLLKTTRYTFEAPCVLGAILAGAAPEKQDDLARVMEPLGLAFQIHISTAGTSFCRPICWRGRKPCWSGRPTSGSARWTAPSCRCACRTPSETSLPSPRSRI